MVFFLFRNFQKLEKQRRKSMFTSVGQQLTESTSDIGSLYGSSDNVNQISAGIKRERSTSPYSPAYSPIKAFRAKRRKLSQEKEQATASALDSEELNNSNASQTSSTVMTTSNSEIFNKVEFRKYFLAMREAHIPHNTNEKLEKSFLVATRNMWLLQEIYEREMELQQKSTSPVEEGVNNGTLKRLSARLKSIIARKTSVSLSRTQTPERSMTPLASGTPSTEAAKPKPKAIQNRPMAEVIDDIFNLDSKYLFKGLSREPVCKYCYKPGGNLKRCTKSCNSYLHDDCLAVDSNKNLKRKRKAVPLKQQQNQIETDSEQKLSAAGAEETASVDLNNSSENNAMPHHVTSEIKSLVPVVCKECASDVPVNCCMVCQAEKCVKKPEDPLVKCTMQQCDRMFHPACCKYWPQAKLTISKNSIESFRCPSHVCHTCVSDDPKGKFHQLSNSKIVKCVKCPATYHPDSTCIPAGSEILTAAHIICPRHAKKQKEAAINVNWCFICVSGGQVVCCETCPIAVHASCLQIPIDPDESYICEECESGRLPLYGEMVWAKFNNYRWWPSIILPPTEIPQNILKKPHNPNDFVVRFFGTHDHAWISRRRVYLYMEGDSSEPPRSKTGK